MGLVLSILLCLGAPRAKRQGGPGSFLTPGPPAVVPLSQVWVAGFQVSSQQTPEVYFSAQVLARP